MECKYLHIGIYSAITKKYYEFIKSNFNLEEHEFIYLKGKNPHNVSFKNTKVVTVNRLIDIFKIIPIIYRAEKVFFHGLYLKKLILLFLFQPWLLKKCYWVIWGGDLYAYRKPRTNIKSKLGEFVRRFVIKRMGHIVSLVRGDYELVRKWYGAGGTYYHGAYKNPISTSYLDALPLIKKSIDSPYVIQIGNSADPTNNHLEAFKKLEYFKDENIKIYTPLSYGNKLYRKIVIEEGKKIFGEKYIALTEFLPPEEYSVYLNNIDIAIFNNDRQQALGNIYALLYLNKKVYIRSDTSMWTHFKENFGIDMNDFLSIENSNFKDFVDQSENQNSEKVKIVFEENYLVSNWEKIFYN